MRGASASPAPLPASALPAAVAVALAAACRTDFEPPPATADLSSAPEFSTTSSSSTSTTELPPEPRLDLPYPDFPGPACSERPLADQCNGGCGNLPADAIAEVCSIPAPSAPAPFHSLLFDCACSDNNDVLVADLDGD